MLLFHSPNGAELWVAREAIAVVQPARGHHDHLHGKINSVLWITGKGFGVAEATDDAARLIKQCEGGR